MQHTMSVSKDLLSCVGYSVFLVHVCVCEIRITIEKILVSCVLHLTLSPWPDVGSYHTLCMRLLRVVIDGYGHGNDVGLSTYSNDASIDPHNRISVASSTKCSMALVASQCFIAYMPFLGVRYPVLRCLLPKVKARIRACFSSDSTINYRKIYFCSTII